MKYLFELIAILIIFTACSSTQQVKENVDPEYSYDLANEYYEMGVQNIGEADWFSAEVNLEKAVDILAVVMPRATNADDTVKMANQQLFDDILILLDEVYLNSYDVIEIDTELVFPELEIEFKDKIFSERQEFVADSIDYSVFDMPIVINARVLRELNYLSTVVPTFMETSLSRMTHYESMIRAKLKENNMPTDIIYQALIESGFKHTAYSTASASGIWQFIGATGKRYGLKSDYWYDQRRNPDMATEAAIKYLTMLYNDFGDWYLAFAAYNCGENRVRRLIKKYETRDYWKLPLPKETMRYVPRIIAAAIIGHYPQKFSMNIQRPEPPPESEEVQISHCMSLDVVAEMLQVHDSIIRFINPEISRWCTPPNVDSFVLKVPKGTKDKFVEAYDRMDKSKLVKWVGHDVKRGETLGAIAKKYGVTTQALKAANKLKNSSLKARQSLIIPISSTKYEKLAKKTDSKNEKVVSQKGSKKDISKAKHIYAVRSGDNLYTIARKMGVSVQNILSWNSLSLKSVLHVGQKIKVYGVDETVEQVPDPKGEYLIHTVENGESLYMISKKYNVSLAELKKLNDIEDSRIYSGQELKIKKDTVTTSVQSVPKRDDTSTNNDNNKARVSHKVRDGESIFRIALKYNVSVDDIKEWNRMNGTKIFPGQKLAIYSASAGDVSSEPEHDVHHIVKDGESLWSIAKRYGLSIQKIKVLNNIESRIVPGMKLKIK